MRRCNGGSKFGAIPSSRFWLDGTVIVESTRISLGDIETTVTLAGPLDGQAVLLVHGFPDDRHGWDRQILPLAEAGFRVIAIDQRGCGEAGDGTSRRSYAVSSLVDDAGAALDALEIEHAHLVGHDWGGVVGWTAAIENRPWLDRLAIVNVPHPAVFARFVRTHPGQMLRSWYMLAFQVPRLPELALGARDAALLSRVVTASSTRAAFTPEDLSRYRSMWSRPGRIGSMLDWYRAARASPIPRGRVSVPTLIVWGDRDVALDGRMADLSAALCDHGRLVRLERASHWPHRDEPDRVNQLLIDHLRT
jgi:pimeloyl-ACP methyl ester carboxylesterase